MAFSFNSLCSNLIPVGKYKVQVTDIKFKTATTGESSKDMVVTYTIMDGPMARKTIMDTIYEKSFSFRLRPFLVACKVDLAREFATAEELYKFGLSAAKNSTIMVDIGIRSYNGNDYNQVTAFYPLAGSATTAEEVLESFSTEPNLKETVLNDGADAIEEAESEPELDVNLEFNDNDLAF